MYVVAVIALARSVEDEAPALAADLGLTVYESGMMLRAPMPVVVLRTDDRARAMTMLDRLRARRHDAVGVDLASVVSSEAMFCPKSFRFDAGDFVGVANGEEQRLPPSSMLALIRANHLTHVEDVVGKPEKRLSLGRAALTGGLMLTKTKKLEATRVTDEREAVLYVFRSDGVPWLLRGASMRYDGLGRELKISRVENFEVLIRVLRELTPAVPFDKRLLAVHPAPATVTASGSKHLSASSASTMDLLAHIVAMSHAVRPYR